VDGFEKRLIFLQPTLKRKRPGGAVQWV